MKKKDIDYKFRYAEDCNMCGSSTNSHKILGKRLNVSQGKKPHKKIGISTSVVKCNNCGLIYSNPQPIPFDIQDHYGVPPENYWTNDYLFAQENYYMNEINKLMKLINFEKGMKSLDIGSGLGHAMISLSNMGFDSYGLEPSKPFYEKSIEKMGINAEKLKLGMLEEVDYPENYFDFITFGAVLEHLYDPSESIQKAMKWLKPNGIIHIEVPSSEWLINKIINIYYKLIGTDYVGNISPMHTPFHLYEFGLNSFKKHSEIYGYEIAKYEYYVCDTYLPKFLDFLVKPYMKWTNSEMQLSIWLKKSKV